VKLWIIGCCTGRSEQSSNSYLRRDCDWMFISEGLGPVLQRLIYCLRILCYGNWSLLNFSLWFFTSNVTTARRGDDTLKRIS
jgi:hypothetical protein